MEKKTVKHLLVVTPGFPGNEGDTTCLPAVQEFLKVYKRIFPDVKISVLSLEYPYSPKTYKWHGITVYPIAGKNRSGLRKWLTIRKTIRKGVAINKQNKIDAVLSLWLSASAECGKIIARSINVPHLIWLHGQDAKAGNKYFGMLSPKADDLAAISEYQNNILYSSYGIKAKYIVHNGINDSSFPEFNSGGRSIDLIAVGSLISLKRYDLFVEIVRYIKDMINPDVQAILAGKGLEEEKLKALIIKHGLQDNLTMTGEVSHTEVLKLMNNAKVFLHPSEYEGHSTVMLEALYSGCKVAGFMPLGSKHVEAFKLCSDMEDMKSSVVSFLSRLQIHNRIKYTDMADSVKQVQSILFKAD